jgi:Ca2+/H+ antiporter, TMEM165/GDT1 family
VTCGIARHVWSGRILPGTWHSGGFEKMMFPVHPPPPPPHHHHSPHHQPHHHHEKKKQRQSVRQRRPRRWWWWYETTRRRITMTMTTTMTTTTMMIFLGLISYILMMMTTSKVMAQSVHDNFQSIPAKTNSSNSSSSSTSTSSSNQNIMNSNNNNINNNNNVDSDDPHSLFQQFDTNHDQFMDENEFVQALTQMNQQQQQQQRKTEQVASAEKGGGVLLSFADSQPKRISDTTTTTMASPLSKEESSPSSSSSSSSLLVRLSQWYNTIINVLHTYASGHDDSLWHWHGYTKAMTKSIAMIMATEIGDKTFFIAAILSMKHNRQAVFCGAITALVIMTILSTAMGLILPQFIPKSYTHCLGGILFLYFGIQLVHDSSKMDVGKVSEELHHVEEELQIRSKKTDETKKKSSSNSNNSTTSTILADVEQGSTMSTTSSSSSSSTSDTKSLSATSNGTKVVTPTSNNLLSSISSLTTCTRTTTTTTTTITWTQVLIQALVLTFIAEWGDRSQIATIALAASYHAIGVTVGAIVGHGICTGMAVMGGRMLASRISEKVVAQYGGYTFLFFGIHSLFLEE